MTEQTTVMPSRTRSTGALAEFVAHTSRDHLPEAADEVVMHTPMADALLKLEPDPGGAAQSRLILNGRKLLVASGKFIYAQVDNILDADETMQALQRSPAIRVIPDAA